MTTQTRQTVQATGSSSVAAPMPPDRHQPPYAVSGPETERPPAGQRNGFTRLSPSGNVVLAYLGTHAARLKALDPAVRRDAPGLRPPDARGCPAAAQHTPDVSGDRVTPGDAAHARRAEVARRDTRRSPRRRSPRRLPANKARRPAAGAAARSRTGAGQGALRPARG